MNKSVLPSSRVLAALLFMLACALLTPCATALASGALPWFAPGQQTNASAANASTANASAPAHAAKASAPDPQAAILTLLAACPAPANATAASPDPAVQAAVLVLLAACPGPAAAPVAAAIPAAIPAAASPDPVAQAAILARLSVAPVPPASPDSSAEPTDPDGQAQFAVLRRYFRSQLTLAEDFPEVFSRRVKDSETMAYMTMCAMQRKRGLLERFRSAEVDVSRLVFTRVTSDPDLARIRVTGRYSFTLGPRAKVEEEPRATGAEGPQSRIEDAAMVRTEGNPQAAPDGGSNGGPNGGPKALSTAALAALSHDGPNAHVVEHRVEETLVEDALFVLLPEMGEWKIYERREGWRP